MLGCAYIICLYSQIKISCTISSGSLRRNGKVHYSAGSLFYVDHYYYLSIYMLNIFTTEYFFTENIFIWTLGFDIYAVTYQARFDIRSFYCEDSSTNRDLYTVVTKKSLIPSDFSVLGGCFKREAINPALLGWICLEGKASLRPGGRHNNTPSFGTQSNPRKPR